MSAQQDPPVQPPQPQQPVPPSDAPPMQQQSVQTGSQTPPQEIGQTPPAPTEQAQSDPHSMSTGNTPPVDTGGTQPPPGQLPDIAPSPSPQTPAGTTFGTPTPPKRKPPKMLFIGLLILLVLAVVGVAIAVILPRLGGGSGGNVELTWWGLWEDESIVQPLIEEYQAANPNVTITYIQQNKQDYRERLVNEFAKGEDGAAPDIFRYHNTWVPMLVSHLDTIPSEVISAQEFSETFYPVAVNDVTTGAGLAGIPLMYDGLALLINTDIFTTYGKVPPRTWTEFFDTAKELTVVDESGVIRQAGAALGTVENVDHWPEILGLLMLQNGANPATPNTDTAEQAIQYYNRFRSSGIWDETLPNSTLAFATNQLAMYIGPSWRALEIRESNPNISFQVLPVPQLPKDDPNEEDITYASYWIEGVWARSESSVEAWKFLKFLSSRESLEKFYQSASQVRGFGELYPRVDMQNLILSDPNIAGFIELAPTARSWYLASRTFDGPTGINTLLSQAYIDAINENVQRAQTNVRDVLVQYRLVSAPPPSN